MTFLLSIPRLVLLPLLLLLLLLLLQTSSVKVDAAAIARNIYGDPLVSCSTDGMALTGYTRNGYCISDASDYGSHHVCINLNSTISSSTTTTSTTTNRQRRNFCHVTGQPDWCSSSMPCHTNTTTTTTKTTTTISGGYKNNNNNGLCQIQNWCVCEWAFATYIEKAGGCHMIQDIICEAIHTSVLTAYREASSSSSSSSSLQQQKKYKKALACIMKRCQLGMMKEL